LMKTYKFNTRITKTGSIQIPFTPALIDKEVEVIIIPKTAGKAKNFTAKKFVKKWAGSLSPDNLDEAKYLYLKGKYK